MSFLTLLEAEELALSILLEWREKTQPTLGAGTLSTGGLDSTVLAGVGVSGLSTNDYILTNNTPAQIINAADPAYTANRTMNQLAVAWYLLTGEDQYNSFLNKFAALDKAAQLMCALPDYTITGNETDVNLQKANLIIAYGFLSRTNQQHIKAATFGIKKEKRGDAETEYFTPRELLEGGALLVPAAPYLKDYKKQGSFGTVLTTDSC